MSRKKRRTQWEIWCDEGLEEEYLELLRGLAKMGLNRDLISKELGITADTLASWCVKYPKVKEALRKGSSYLYADSANILIDMMHDETLDPSLRASIASRFLSWEKQRWDAIMQKEVEESDDKKITFVFERKTK